MSPSQRRFDERRRRIALLEAERDRDEAAARGALDEILGNERKPRPLSVVRSVQRVLHNTEWNEGFVRSIEGEAVSVAVAANRREPNLDVCARFAVKQVLLRRSMMAMVDVVGPVDAIRSGVATRQGCTVRVDGFDPKDLAGLVPLISQTRCAVVRGTSVTGVWKPEHDRPHLFGGDPLCPPAEALALVADWHRSQDVTGSGELDGIEFDAIRAPRPEIVTLGLGPFAGPMLLAAMTPTHDVVVDGFPIDRRAVVSPDPVSIVVNLASENAFRLGAALVPQLDRDDDLPRFRCAYERALRQIDGFGPTCGELLKRTQRFQKSGRPVFVLGGPGAHAGFANLTSELGLAAERLHGHDASRGGIYVSNHKKRSRRDIPHLPGVVVSLWRWT